MMSLKLSSKGMLIGMIFCRGMGIDTRGDFFVNREVFSRAVPNAVAGIDHS
jgi:hypothetical protein